MNRLTKDFIAIDANVFLHLLNPPENVGEHITNLLQRLIDDNIHLLVDDDDRIVNEYNSRLGAYMDKTMVGEENADRVLLRYWFFPDHQERISVVEDQWMIAIKKIIPTKKGKSVTDRFYVYVAFKKGRILVTNDEEDIYKKRVRLKQKAKRHCPKSIDILNSREACNKL